MRKRSNWDFSIWYSKYYDQLVVADQFCRIWTCYGQPLGHMRYVSGSLEYVGRID